MTPENFCYWLQGFFEIDGTDDQKRVGLTAEQCDMIKQYLGYVFGKPESEKPKASLSVDGKPQTKLVDEINRLLTFEPRASFKVC